MRPALYSIWEKIQRFLYERMKSIGVQNACLSMSAREKKIILKGLLQKLHGSLELARVSLKSLFLSVLLLKLRYILIMRTST